MYTVLVVDDSRDEIEITKRVLARTRNPVKVLSVTSGEAALELLRGLDELPSLILIDLKMPGMGGIDTLRQIRSDERLRHIRVVIFTNSSLESDRREAFAAGADNFLSKSFDIEHFSKEIKHLLER